METRMWIETCVEHVKMRQFIDVDSHGYQTSTAHSNIQQDRDNTKTLTKRNKYLLRKHRPIVGAVDIVLYYVK